jgi:hypothetical protein
VNPFVEKDPRWAATNVEPWAMDAAVQVEDTSVPSARPALVLCNDPVLGDLVPGLCDPAFGDAVRCAATVTAFNPFETRVVVRVGALHWSCKDFLWPNFLGPEARHSKSVSTNEKDGEDFVAPDSR